MLNVNKPKELKVKYKDLTPGDVFSVKSNYYIKIDSTELTSNYCVCLDTLIATAFDEDTDIILRNYTFIVDGTYSTSRKGLYFQLAPRDTFTLGDSYDVYVLLSKQVGQLHPLNVCLNLISFKITEFNRDTEIDTVETNFDIK